MIRRTAGWMLLLVLPAALIAQRPQYPPAARDTVVDIYFGTRVPAPYRWLEDLSSPATASWIGAENALTRSYLSRLPERERIRRRLTELWDYPRVSLPGREAGRLFYRRNDGLQQQSVLYYRDSLSGAARPLLDPNTLSPDGSIAFSSFSVSPDGRYLAYGLATGGSDLQNWYIRELATGRDLADTLRDLKFSGASWTRDSRGFVYSRFAAPARGQELSGANTQAKVYYHVVGTSQSSDRLLYQRPDDPRLFLAGGVSEDGRFAWFYVSPGGTENELYYQDLGDPQHPDFGSPVRALAPRADAEYSLLGNVGDTVYLRTTLNAPNRRIVALVLPDTDRAGWRTLIPSGPNVIQAAALAGGRLVVQRLVDVTSRLDLYDRKGQHLDSIPLPGIGTVTDLNSREDTPELWYGFASFLQPATVYHYDLGTGRSTVFEAASTAFDPAPYEIRQVFYPSKDGTRVPMFIVARKDVQLDGRNPTLLYAYGGFDISLLPFYSPALAGWLDLGGVFAIPNLRGGGEYGETWHRAGMREKKQNVFDDFIAAARYLIDQGYTTSPRLAIYGGSNGGLLVGAVMTQHPDLAGVALPAVGVMDMLRYQKFTGGAFWVPEYGSSDDSTAFQWLIRYSPLQNVRPGTCYPATLLTTADHDDRVVPSHTYQFTAALQHAQGCDHPILVRIETEGSHGYRPTDKQIAEYADRWAFALDHPGFGGARTGP